MKPAHRGIGPLLAVLIRAQVMLHEKADLLALVAREREPTVDLVEHPRADFGVTVKVHAVVGKRTSRNFADVMEKRGPTYEWAPHGLLHDLLRVCPHVLVLAPGLLHEIHRGLELGKQHAHDPALLHPFERSVDVVPHERLLDGNAQAGLVGLLEPWRVLLSYSGDAVGRCPAFGRNRPSDLDHDDGIGLDEAANAVRCALLGRHAGDTPNTDYLLDEQLVPIVLKARAPCRVVLPSTIFRKPSSRCPASRDFTPGSPRSPRPSSTFCGRSKAATCVVRRARVLGSVRVADALLFRRATAHGKLTCWAVTVRRNPETRWGTRRRPLL